MEHFSGLETSICIEDDSGQIVREVKVASEPNVLLLKNSTYRFKRIAVEVGPSLEDTKPYQLFSP
jgi:hypothetical protein